MITKEQIHVRLSEAIKQSGFTEEELAQKLKISQTKIAQYIKGSRLPKIDVFGNLAKLLNVDPNYILCLK